MPKLLMTPPLKDYARRWADRLTDEQPGYSVVLAEDEETARRELPDADAVFGWVSPEQLPLARKLRWMQSPIAAPEAGYYYPALVEHPVTVCNPRGVYNDHISQHIVMVMLALARGLPEFIDAQRESRWDKEARLRPCVNLAGTTALIVGVGGIGHETARLCTAFGMRVIGIDDRWEYETPDVERHRSTELDDLLPVADFVIVTVPHTPETEGMWHSGRFRRMKESACFINIGRGATTRLEDLADALENGEIAGCSLDVFETEPLPPDHRLWGFRNAILTPHIAVHDVGGLEERWWDVFSENARRFAAGQPLRNVVDKALWF